MHFQSKVASRSRLFAALLGGASTIALGSMPAIAQNAADDENLETVVVTGTLLKGIAPVGTNVIQFSSADIKSTGGVTVDQVLTNIPQVSSLFGRSPRTQTSGGGTIDFAPSLRNIPGQSTLLLINNHDVVGMGTLNVSNDASAIPAIVLQRVDIVADGGSAIYGSNAVAGIINFITRKDFDGLQFQTAIGTQGDYNSFDAAFMAGHSWNSGGAYLAYDYRHNSNQFNSDRPYTSNYLVPLGGTIDQRSTACNLANVNAGGINYALTSNTVANTPGSLAAAGRANQTNKCDALAVATAFPEEAQHTVWGQMHQRLTDSVDFSLQVNWARRTASSLLTAEAVTNGVITNANPYFQSIAGETKQLVSFDFSPAFGSTVPNLVTIEQEGFVPQFDIDLGSGWTSTIIGNYARSHVTVQNFGADTVGVTQALGASDPNYALDPYNLNLTPSRVLQNLTNFGSHLYNNQQIEQVKALVNGSPFSLPAGDVKFAAGLQYQYTDQISRNFNGPLAQNNGTAVSGAYLGVGNAHRYVESFFGELAVPLVSAEMGIPFLRTATVDISGRYDHYSDFGGTTNPKIGLTIEPIDGLTLRGNMGTSFVAPSLTDSGNAIDTRLNLQTASPVRVPLAISGKTTQQDAIDANRPAFLIAGGSYGLQPQSANTYSFGFDYHPDFIPGLDLSLTKWHASFFHTIAIVPYTNGPLLYTTPAYSPYYILSPTLDQLNAGKLGTTGLPHAAFTTFEPFFQNGANNTPYVLLDARRHNLGNQFDEGLDWHVGYTFPASFGTVDVGWDGTVYSLYKIQAFAGAARTNGLDANQVPYQFSLHGGLTMGALTGRLTYNYMAGYSTSGVTAQTHVSAFQLTNLFLSYDLEGTWDAFSGATIGLNVDNLFDVQPPFVNLAPGVPSGSTFPTESTLGRFFQITLSKKF